MKGLPLNSIKVATTGIALLGFGYAIIALNLPLGVTGGFMMGIGAAAVGYAALDRALGGK